MLGENNMAKTKKDYLRGKQLFIVIAIVIVSAGLSVTNAFAQYGGGGGWGGNGGNPDEFNALYTVNADGSTTMQDIFQWDETPFLYIEFANAASWQDVALTFWDSPTNTMYYTENVYFNNESQLWISLDDGFSDAGLTNPINWFDAREIGDWTIDVVYHRDTKSGDINGTTGFAVVPEPVSSTLFIVGAATLGYRRFRKKR
jgi:hypothetical protein